MDLVVLLSFVVNQRIDCNCKTLNFWMGQLVPRNQLCIPPFVVRRPSLVYSKHLNQHDIIRLTFLKIIILF